MGLSNADILELKQLREFKAEHEGKAINRAFARLEHLMAMPAYDPSLSSKGFRVLAECLICLKELKE